MRDIEALQAPFGAEVRFSVEATVETSVAAFTDGLLSSRLPNAQDFFGVSGLKPGDHTLSLVPHEAGAPISRLYLEPLGQRIRLHWARSEDQDTVAYRVYWDSGADVTPATLIATVSDMTIGERSQVIADSGDGGLIGRLSAFGSVPPGTLTANILLTVGVTAEGAYEWATDNGYSGSGEFSAADTINLPYGVRITFHDDPGDYATGALWAVYIGPAVDYITDTLAPGRYRFAISAIDEAGNESSVGPERLTQIVAVPEALTNVTLADDSGDLLVTWTDSADIAGVHVYCNFDPHTGLFTDYIEDLDLPFADIAAGVEEWSFTEPADDEGRLRFYLRPYFANGIEREDLTVYSWGFPASSVDLGEVLGSPTGLVATPTVGGKWLLEWDYKFKPGDTSTAFYVYRQTTAAPIDFTASPYATVLRTAGTSLSNAANGPRLKHYSYARLTLEPASPVLLAVRAVNQTSGVTGDNTNYVSLVPDAVAPTAPGDLAGGAA